MVTGLFWCGGPKSYTVTGLDLENKYGRNTIPFSEIRHAFIQEPLASERQRLSCLRGMEVLTNWADFK
jgi:hypothetical protein